MLMTIFILIESLCPSHIKTISNPSHSISTKNGNEFWIFNSNSNMIEDSVSAASNNFMSVNVSCAKVLLHF